MKFDRKYITMSVVDRSLPGLKDPSQPIEMQRITLSEVQTVYQISISFNVPKEFPFASVVELEKQFSSLFKRLDRVVREGEDISSLPDGQENLS